jgi:hypothetical protein
MEVSDILHAPGALLPGKVQRHTPDTKQGGPRAGLDTETKGKVLSCWDSNLLSTPQRSLASLLAEPGGFIWVWNLVCHIKGRA